ncbi:MAG: agmatinase [Pseudomonadota bacterium]
MTVPIFLESHPGPVNKGLPAILGLPLDLTSTFRSGSDSAPKAIREASDSIESYSPFLDRDITDYRIVDLGDLTLPVNDLAGALAAIKDRILGVLDEGALPFSLGGEHTVTLPVVEALSQRYPDFRVLHIDAHSDLRDDYDGNPVNHATVMKRIAEIIGPDRLIQLGIRSGTRDEFRWMRRHRTFYDQLPGREANLLSRLKDFPVYLSLDLDVFDPSCFPGTGNPELGGWFYDDFERFLTLLDQVNLVGADVVELNPRLDPSGASSIAAAKVVRELLLVMAGAVEG